MDRVFQSVLNMSITGAFIIAVICLVRLPLKKAPKIISYCLWAVVGFRLICPVSFESAFSLIPFDREPVQSAWVGAASPYEEWARPPEGTNSPGDVNHYDTPAESAIIERVSIVWLIGAAAILTYSFISIILLKRRLRGAAHIESNLYEAANLRTPFVIGLFRPKIYLPAGLSGEERRYILLHEQTHIRRRDHAVKMFAYLVLCLHWFNPLAWIAFVLMGADMEMSCDERVMRELGTDIKNDYSLSLVRAAAGRKILNGSPLAFGEGGMKERVKNVLDFKKRSRVITLAAVVLVLALTVGFALNRAARPAFTIPYFEAAGLALGDSVEDIDLDDWTASDAGEWDYTSEFGAFRLNDEQRINSFKINVYALSGGTMNMSGITPKAHKPYNAFNIPLSIDEILAEFGEGSERYDAPENSKDDWSHVRYEDAKSGITVHISFRKENGQVVYINAEGMTAANPRTTPPVVPVPTQAPSPSVQPTEPTTPKPAGMPIATGPYEMEGLTERDKMEMMYTISLHEDGTAYLYTPLISSYIPPPCTYTIEGSEVLIRAFLETEEHGYGYNLKNGDVIARFKIVDDQTLDFESSAVPLFAGSRYVYSPPYKANEWVNYFNTGSFPQNADLELELPEFPGTMFRWTPGEVTASGPNGEKTLFTGMPVWNVFLADLNGDKAPEVCATISIGSGLIDTRVVVFDYANDMFCELSDRGYYDYVLSLPDSWPLVTQSAHGGGTLGESYLGLSYDGMLTVYGLDRTIPEPETAE